MKNVGNSMKKYFVTFLSPGTFTAETTALPIDRYDTDEAMKIAKTVNERHGAVPYGFYFSTRERAEDELDSKETERSNFYYLGGEVFKIGRAHV